MSSKASSQLQLAVDVLSTADALRIAQAVYPHYDIMEIGTPLIIEDGLRPLETLKNKFPDKLYLADVKIMDAGGVEAASAFKRGADIVTVLAVADDKTIKNALDAAAKYNGRIMIDLINTPDVAARAKQLTDMGVPILCLHTAYDRQSRDIDPLHELKMLRPLVDCSLAVAGGLKLDNIAQAVRTGGDIIVVGGGIITQADPGSAAAAIHRTIKETPSCRP